MMIIDNQVILSDEKLADRAFRRWVEEGYEVEYYSFVQGYLTALKEQSWDL